MRKLIFIGALLGGFYFYRKYTNTVNALNSLEVRVNNIHSVSINGGSVNLKLDLKIINPSNSELGLNTFSVISIKELHFYNRQNNAFIGKANVNISKIEVAAESEEVLKDIPVNIPLKNIFQNISLFTGNANLKVTVVIDVAGKEYILQE